MTSKNKLRETNIKNRMYYYFDDLINIKYLDPKNIKVMKNNAKIFLFTTLDM